MIKSAQHNSYPLPPCVKSLSINFQHCSLTENQLGKILHTLQKQEWDAIPEFTRFPKKSTQLAAGFIYLNNEKFVIHLSRPFTEGSFKKVKDSLYYDKKEQAACIAINGCAHLEHSSTSLSQIAARRTENAIALLQNYKEHFVTIYAVVQSLSKQSIIQEKFDGDLEFLIDQNFMIAENELSYSIRIDMAYQLLEQLVILHRIGLVHRDIKLNNVLYQVFTENNTLKCRVCLTDFDLSVEETEFQNGVFIREKDYHLWPPENWKALQIKKDRIDFTEAKASDIWALGGILYMLLEPQKFNLPWQTFYEQHDQKSFRNFVRSLLNHEPIDPIEFLSFYSMYYFPIKMSRNNHFAKLLLRMVHPDPSQRPSAAEALEEFKARKPSVSAEYPSSESV